MEPWHYIILFLCGAVAGIINVIAGGGSLLTLPAMILMGMPESVANGTNRIAILTQNVVAVASFRNRGFSDFSLSLSLGLCSLPGAIVGAWCGAIIPPEWFNRILAGIMIGVVLLMMGKSRSRGGETDGSAVVAGPRKGRPMWFGHVAMIGVGFYGGFIQAGVGFLIMASQHHLMALDLVRVNMHKVFIMGVFTSAALVVFLLTGNVWWLPGLALAGGNALGGWLGSHLTITRGEVFVRRFLYAALLVMAVKLVLGA